MKYKYTDIPWFDVHKAEGGRPSPSAPCLSMLKNLGKRTYLARVKKRNLTDTDSCK